jgi:transposase
MSKEPSLPKTPTMADLFDLIAGLQAKVALLEAAPSGIEAIKKRIVALETANAAWARRCAALEARVAELEAENKALRVELASKNARIAELEAEVARLERLLAVDSRTSSKTPSGDGFARKARLPAREKTDRKRGGQPGRTGVFPSMSLPTEIDEHAPTFCEGCGASLDGAPRFVVEARQVIDAAPPPPPTVLEHRVLACRCSDCGRRNVGRFPSAVRGSVSLGPRVRSLCAFLSIKHAMPFERSADLVLSLSGVRIAASTACLLVAKMAKSMAPISEAIRRATLSAPIVGVDETGVRVAGKLRWLRGAATKKLSCVEAAVTRGDVFKPSGTIVSDAFGPYLSLEASGTPRAACWAHLVREARALVELDKEPWAQRLADWAIGALRETGEAAAAGMTSLPPAKLDPLLLEFDGIAAEGLAFHAALPPFSRKSKARRPGHRLAIRLVDERRAMTLFLRDLSVPFSNNLAERLFRMPKVKQKISGGFASKGGLDAFAILWSVIDTARKNDLDALEALSMPPPDLMARLRIA